MEKFEKELRKKVLGFLFNLPSKISQKEEEIREVNNLGIRRKPWEDTEEFSGRNHLMARAAAHLGTAWWDSNCEFTWGEHRHLQLLSSIDMERDMHLRGRYSVDWEEKCEGFRDFPQHIKAARLCPTEWGRDVGHRAIALERKTDNSNRMTYQEQQKLNMK